VDLLQEAEILRKVPMFAKLEPSKLKLLAFTSEYQTFEDGEILFHAGDPADCAFVILGGEVEILAKTDAGDVVVGVLRDHQIFGELALLNKAPRLSTLRAKNRLQVLRITDEVFLKLVTENPEVALDLMHQLSDKLALSHQRVEALQSELHRNGS
jgi:CRP-like cAMP-binding protein